jgi:hypothetical protein
MNERPHPNKSNNLCQFIKGFKVQITLFYPYIIGLAASTVSANFGPLLGKTWGHIHFNHINYHVPERMVSENSSMLFMVLVENIENERGGNVFSADVVWSV